MTTAKTKQYYQGIGRRKEAVARVRIYPGGKGKVTVNGVEFEKAVPEKGRREIITSPLEKTGSSFDVTIVVKGGGKAGQVIAIRMGVARAIVSFDKAYRPTLKAEGFLKRDSRVKERMKPGLKKARRRKQWRKR